MPGASAAACTRCSQQVYVTATPLAATVVSAYQVNLCRGDSITLCVVADVFGYTGRRMLRVVCDGGALDTRPKLLLAVQLICRVIVLFLLLLLCNVVLAGVVRDAAVGELWVLR